MASNKRVNVGILGATGAVGQTFIRLLNNHPYFNIAVLGASDRSAGQLFENACVWRQPTPMPKEVGKILVVECVPSNFVGKCEIVFSALGTDIAGALEVDFANAGLKVCSNSSPHRQDPDVPLLVPYVNPGHFELVKAQPYYKNGGWIVTNANCSTTGLVIAMKPVFDKYGISECMVSTLQAISGAGYTGIYGMDICDNVIPYIGNEEEKLELEPLKILGGISAGKSQHLTNMKISANCHRVNVIDGHMVTVSLRLEREPASIEELEETLRSFKPEFSHQLPSLPEHCIVVSNQPNRPQPRLDRDVGGGYTVTVGRVRRCPLFGYKFVCLVHNLVMGAAGSAILNAELAVAGGYL